MPILLIIIFIFRYVQKSVGYQIDFLSFLFALCVFVVFNYFNEFVHDF